MTKLVIEAPEDTITGMGRRAYEEYVAQRRQAIAGMRFPPWKQLIIAVKANWRNIVAKALGEHGEIINVNPMNRHPHTIIITGLTADAAVTLHQGLKARMTAITSPVVQQEQEESDGDAKPTE